jgi:hypothetical protein
VQPLGCEASYALNGCSENVVVKPIIIPELELRNVKMQVFLTNVVECADDTAPLAGFAFSGNSGKRSLIAAIGALSHRLKSVQYARWG